jgi:NAD(P)-dependent dehydrogenase (short-subunit alcohol dehydrogenase family)
MRLQDKATIVTGASSGIAEAIALGFAREVAMIIGENR